MSEFLLVQFHGLPALADLGPSLLELPLLVAVISLHELAHTSAELAHRFTGEASPDPLVTAVCQLQLC